MTSSLFNRLQRFDAEFAGSLFDVLPDPSSSLVLFRPTEDLKLPEDLQGGRIKRTYIDPGSHEAYEIQDPSREDVVNAVLAYSDRDKARELWGGLLPVMIEVKWNGNGYKIEFNPISVKMEYSGTEPLHVVSVRELLGKRSDTYTTIKSVYKI